MELIAVRLVYGTLVRNFGKNGHAELQIVALIEMNGITTSGISHIRKYVIQTEELNLGINVTNA